MLGIVNVTPDSFSDGGCFQDVDTAVEHGFALWQRGADLIDVGGESTKPGAQRVTADTETARILPVITQLVAEGVRVSVDTTRASVARAAIDAGASVINDVSGGLADPNMTRLVAEADVGYLLMHGRGPSATMSALATYHDVVAEVCAELQVRVDAAVAAGVSPDAIVLDPGIGFAKTATHNWQLLSRLDVLASLGFPILIGASRKRFLGALLADSTGVPRPAEHREAATVAITTLAAAAGVWAVRVHEVGPSLDAVAVAAACARAGK